MARGKSLSNPSFSRCIVLVLLMMALYLFDTPLFASNINSSIYNYILKPCLWLGLAFFIHSLPRVKHKAKRRYSSLINLWAFNFSIIFVVIFILAGLFDGFGKSPYNHSPIGMLLNLVLLGSVLVGRELTRSYIVNSLTDEENYLIFIFVALLMTITSIALNQFTGLNEYFKIISFAAQHFAPEFSKNLFACYLSYLGGPVAAIVYMGTIEVFYWASPILPDLKWITTGFLGVLCPLFSLTTMQSVYAKEAKVKRRREMKEESPLGWMLTCIFSIGIIWFSVGVFPVYPSVVATGSMEPMIKPGDVIIVDKSVKPDNLREGDVIQFRREDILISHRIVSIREIGKDIGYKTKGDNNSAADRDIVKQEQIKGKVIYVVPKIGWPTLLIRSKNDIPLDRIQY